MVAPKGGGGPRMQSRDRRKKNPTREAKFKKAKAQETAALKAKSASASAAILKPSAKGKAKAREVEEDPHPFRYKSFNDRLAAAHINISRKLGKHSTAGLEGYGLVRKGEDEDGKDEGEEEALNARTSFGAALQTWKELNLSLPFLSLAQEVQSLSLSLPLLLHNQEHITSALSTVLNARQYDSYHAFEPVLDIIPRLAEDLGSAFMLSYTELLKATLQVTLITKNNAEGEEHTAAHLVEKAFESAAATLRCVAPHVLNEGPSVSKESDESTWLVRTWEIVRPYLGWREIVRHTKKMDVETERTEEEDVDNEDVDNEDVDNEDVDNYRESLSPEEIQDKGSTSKRPGKSIYRSRRPTPPHTRRFASEALAHLVRKARGKQLANVARVMMSDVALVVKSEEDNNGKGAKSALTDFSCGVAGVWTEVVKSVDNRLHSSAQTQVSAALLSSLEEANTATYRASNLVGTYLFTALVHHSQGPYLGPLNDFLIKHLNDTLDQNGRDGGIITGFDLREAALVNAADWLIALIGTRKGKRVDEDAKPLLFSSLLRVATTLQKSGGEASPKLLRSLLKLLAIALPVGRIQDLIGPGIKIFEILSPQGSSLAIFSTLVTSLNDLDWQGFRQVALPAVIKHTTNALASNDVKSHRWALELCASLQERGSLDFLATATPNPSTARWISALSRTVHRELSAFGQNIEMGQMITSNSAAYKQHLTALLLVPLFGYQAETFVAPLIDIVSHLLRVCALPEYAKSMANKDPVNPAAILGATLEALVSLMEQGPPEVSQLVLARLSAETDGKFGEIPIFFCWHRSVLLQFSRLCESAQRKRKLVTLPSLDLLAVSLSEPLMSCDHSLRLVAGKLLSMSEAQCVAVEDQRLLWRLVQIEETALEVETIRDRNVRTRAVARELLRLSSTAETEKKDCGQLQVEVDLVIRYLVSTLKLNFKPLWEETRKALVDLASRFGDDVWEISFKELQQSRPVQSIPEGWRSFEQTYRKFEEEIEEGEDQERAVEKYFRDPQLRDRKLVVDMYFNAALMEQDEAYHGSVRRLLEEQRLHGRLDIVNYRAQILKLIGNISRLAERHNAHFMKHFFSTVVADKMVLNEEDGAAGLPSEESSDGLRLTLPERRVQLCAYLETFAQFSGPKSLYRSEDLYDFLLALCAQGDSTLQKLALDCILLWKNPAHTTYSTILKGLIEQSTFREQLTSLDLSSTGDSVQPAHRPSFMSLLMRLFYGLMISRKGKWSSGSGSLGRRTAILVALSEVESSEFRTFIDLMLSPFADQLPTQREDGSFVFAKQPPSASRRRQGGFLSLLADVIKHLSLKLQPFWSELVGVTLNIVFWASRNADQGQGKMTLPDRSIRQAGIKRIDEFFHQPTQFEWSPFLPAFFDKLISPRLPLLSVESVQSPSALLEMFHTWSARSDQIHLLVAYDSTLLDHVSACLAVDSVKLPVVSRILDIVERAQSFVEQDNDETRDQVRERIIRPHVSSFLRCMQPLVSRYSSATSGEAKVGGRDDMLRRMLRVLAGLAPFVTTPSDASSLLELLSPMLRKNNVLIPERSKTDLLQIFQDLLVLCPSFQDPTSHTFGRHYHLLTSLFGSLRSREARTRLAGVMNQFARIDVKLQRAAEWSTNLNAFSKKRMEEPDFDLRLKAFDQINDDQLSPLISLQEWLPVVQNMLFYIQDAEELAIRSNAGMTLRRFIDGVQMAHVESKEGQSYKEMRSIFSTVVYAGLRRCLKLRSELVRREVLSVVGYAAHRLDDFAQLAEMRGLLAEGDEEANFFNNIHHIQIHRRARALRRLGEQAEKGALKSKTISEVFAPLVGHFLVVENVEKSDHNLINEAITCLGHLTRQLQWGPYNALLWKYLRLANGKTENEKVFVRAAMAILDNFHFNMDEETLVEDEVEYESGGEGEVEVREKEAAQSRKVLNAVSDRLLPKLMGYLEQRKDDTDDAVRLPIAVGIVRVMQSLPVGRRELEVQKLLTTMANVLKSKSQETRDLARETLSKVALSLGPDYFAMLMRELRTALTRGPQLAVMAFTVHSVLVHLMTAKQDPLTLLEDGAADLVHIAAEDIFGQTAEDREMPEYRSKVREMRQSKSMDTFEQAAKVVAPTQMSTMLLPLRDIMQQTEGHRAVRGVEGVLRRIASGLNSNVHFDDATFLILIHALVSRQAPFLQPRKTKAGARAQGKPAHFTVLLKRKDVEAEPERDHLARNVHRFVAFGLDLFVTAMRRTHFSFSNERILSRLDPLIPVLGNCLYANEMDVVMLALKAIASIIKAPLPSLGKSLPILIKQTMVIVQREGGAHSEVSQTALKTLATAIRECKQAEFTEKQLAEICRLIIGDLEETEIQSTLFSLLRAIVGRKFVVSEVYEAMDKVAEMLVTNQSSSVRESCRSLFLLFLLDYPQGKNRLRNQMEFLAKNVSYVYESGRLSVMELLRVILAKFSDDVLVPYLDLFFVALVMVLANDDSPKCRENAGVLIKTIAALSETESRDKLIYLTHGWAEQEERPVLSRVAMQVYGLLMEANPASVAQWQARALLICSKVLQECAEDLETLERGDMEIDSSSLLKQIEWQLPYQTLQAVLKLMGVEESQRVLLSKQSHSLWKGVRELLLFPHAWVRIAACRLLASRFAASPIEDVASVDDPMEDSPLSVTKLVDTAKKLSLQLKSPLLDETLGLQVVKNLLYIGKSFALIQRANQAEGGKEEEEKEEEEREGNGGGVSEDRGALENPLAWLFSKLSYQARSAPLSRVEGEGRAGRTIQSATILRWFAAMAQHLSTVGSGDRLTTYLVHIIHPLFRILDDDTIKGEDMEELKNLATEVQELVQSLVGTSQFASVYQRIRTKVLEKRKERRTERLMMGIKDPERAMKRKQRENENKRKSRKRKVEHFQRNKEKIRPLKRNRM